MPPTPAPAEGAKPSLQPLSGPARALRKLGLACDIDLALHLPMRYEDETRLVPIASLREGEVGQVQGVVRDSRVETRARRQLVVYLADESGELVLRLLHFYPAQQKALAPGQCVRARGELRGGFFGREMVHPEFRAVAPDAPLPQALTPVYPASAALPQAYLRKAVASALARAPLAEILPPATLPTGLPSLREALQLLHQPPPGTPLAAIEDHSHPAWQRLKFEELLAQQLAQRQAQAARARLAAPALAPHEDGLAFRLRAALPFALTGAQQRVVAEIGADLALAQPMHRLLQGDVGSGKTVVAALAAAVAMDAGWQCALMAPTEILAEQHFRKLVGWLAPLGITTAWLSGSRKGKARQKMVEQVASGEALLVVGTHAVIQHDVAFARLGLAVVDEQHRFGVAQRLALRQKLERQAVPAPGRPKPAQPPRGVAEAQPEPGGPHLEPHLLMMSATPIPRTLAMSYFADLAVSTLDELPPGRTPVLTKVFADAKRAQVIGRIRDEVAQGRQVYWVCPLVEESEHLDLQNATATHAELAAALPGVNVALLHGRMRAAEKAAVMAGFTAGQTQLLVATTVIEVGVDVPNASLMVIEHAERFGLAQLHQLRGRVGRGATASVCVLLFTGPLSPTGKARLRTMAETSDGFEIARRDLEIRGPGEFMGARQSGDALLRFADLAADDALLQRARAEAPRLLRERPEVAEAQVQRWLAGRAEFLKA
ncbi:ATP-dependent DNA helicase RecG [Rubrivivax sp. A210]|uniref:ATP-dependent DNA helicase RecG n=1 Tax=Rubrivivax sp. A210 TaxID=2772301 RepID=UPI00191B41B6|nr:ATP-dependent DNA helicase RecG [Rubrivivax sp. A210]CAD5373461.1 ATP-dependent DNA helicase RecG [Rubrivivax sp. A210]